MERASLEGERWIKDHFRGRDFMKLSHHRSNRGARSFDDGLLPGLTFESFASLTPAGAAAVRARVEGLAAKEDHFVVFRGQKRASPRGLCQLPADPREFVFAGLRSSASAHYQRIEEHSRASVAYTPKIAEAIARQCETLRVSTPLDALVEHHQTTNGSPLLISASRSLSVAAGNYIIHSKCRPTDNPYIYVLHAPESALVNVHAPEITWCDRVAGDIQACKAAASREAEVSVWLDARPFVVGAYDARRESWI